MPTAVEKALTKFKQAHPKFSKIGDLAKQIDDLEKVLDQAVSAAADLSKKLDKAMNEAIDLQKSAIAALAEVKKQKDSDLTSDWDELGEKIDTKVERVKAAAGAASSAENKVSNAYLA